MWHSRQKQVKVMPSVVPQLLLQQSVETVQNAPVWRHPPGVAVGSTVVVGRGMPGKTRSSVPQPLSTRKRQKAAITTVRQICFHMFNRVLVSAPVSRPPVEIGSPQMTKDALSRLTPLL